jgi:hypothetical protein
MHYKICYAIWVAFTAIKKHPICFIRVEAYRREAWNVSCHYLNMQLAFLFIFTDTQINLLQQTVLSVNNLFRWTTFWAIIVINTIRKQQPYIRPFIPSSVQCTRQPQTTTMFQFWDSILVVKLRNIKFMDLVQKQDRKEYSKWGT